MNNKFMIYYRKIVTKSYPKYMNLIKNTSQNMKPYLGSGAQGLPNAPGIHVGTNNLIAQNKQALIKREPALPGMEEEGKNNLSNQERINQLNKGATGNLESALGDLFN